MNPLSAHDLLAVWEAGEDKHPLDRALTLLATASPEQTWEDLAALSIGRRDASLLAVREQTYGPKLEGFVQCPHCSESLEFDLTVADLVVESSHGEKRALELESDGYELRFRLPDSRDLASLLGARDSTAAHDLLLERCVLKASRGGEPVEVGDLPAGVAADLSVAMSEHDPQAEVLLDLLCPACEHRWQALFDIVTFFWTELANQAQRLLREVHALARAYGWREADILAMSARRRQFYMEMAT